MAVFAKGTDRHLKAPGRHARSDFAASLSGGPFPFGEGVEQVAGLVAFSGQNDRSPGRYFFSTIRAADISQVSQDL